MNERDSNLKGYQELPLLPEDKTDLFEIVSWVNEITTREYPIIPPINIDQIKIVSNEDFEKVHIIDAEKNLHPFFLNVVKKDQISFGAPPGAHSWIVHH